jgi:hypothetical protein
MAAVNNYQVNASKHGDFSKTCRVARPIGSWKSFRQNTTLRTSQRASRNLLITTASSSAAAASFNNHDLATYRLPHHSSIGHSTAAPWFQAAVTEVVKHLESSPFLQLVRFSDALDPLTAFKEPKLSSFSVPESVVSVPELWSSIAEAVTADSADVVILVQRIDPHGTGAIDTSAATQQPVDDSLKAHVEEACQKLVASGIGESILLGKVGDCCENHAHHTSHPSSSSSILSTSTSSGSVVPFSSSYRTVPSVSPSAIRGASIKVKALGTPEAATSSPAPLSGYWGVVVQSKHHTGAEGCYLLRAVRQVCPPVANNDHGCTCTHYSLTKVCKGEHMERQFIDSWLV